MHGRRQSTRRPRWVPVAATAVVIVVGLIVGLMLARSSPAPSRAADNPPSTQHAAAAPAGSGRSTASSLPPPAKGFSIPQPQVLPGHAQQTRWAPVLRAVTAHRSPSWGSPAVTQVGLTTPEGTSNLIDADGEVTRDGVDWVRTRLATLPDGTIGWVPRSALGGWSFVPTEVVVDRSTLTLTLYRDGRQVFRTPVGVGKPGTPTPAGRFYVRDRLTRYASPEYGPIAFGTSARSPFVTDWPAGGFIGIHGTDEPNLIPGRVSHGCIRLRNSAILALAKLMPVGTPVIVR